MHILSVEDIFQSHGDKILFNHIRFTIQDDEKIGLIGVNGTGKSTLLKVIAGVEKPESGRVSIGGHMRVHYLPQDPDFDADRTVLQEVFASDDPIIRLLAEYEALIADMSDGENAPEQVARLVKMQSQLEAADAWQLEHEAKTILSRLGIRNFHDRIAWLSGGQRKRIALARALIQPADLLILDEPTNHIDHETVTWLETFLQKRKGALLMVTHDRYFLDRVTNRIFELDGGKLYQYEGNYDRFLEAKLARQEQNQATEEKRQNFLRNELEWIRRGPKARGTKQKARTNRYYEVLEQSNDAAPGSIEMAALGTRLGTSVVEFVDVSKGYDGKPLIRDFSYIVLRTDRIGVVGRNGSGKSTLLQLMRGVLTPDEGEVQIGPTVKIGYFSQELEEMNGAQRVLEYIQEEAHYVETLDGSRISATQMLERFLFPGSMHWTHIAKLSGGEKRRLALLRMLMSSPNVLLLDEPTNDLDVVTLGVLEAYLEDFAGAVVAVSHDRYFLHRVVDKILALDGVGHVTSFQGNYEEFLAEQSNGLAETAEIVSSQKTATEPTRVKENKLKFTYAEQKEFSQIEATIAELEDTLTAITRDMTVAADDHLRLQELYGKQMATEQLLSEKLERWTYLTELAEKIASQQGK